MSDARKRGLVALASGILFGTGLAVSGMTKPVKVIGFLDVLGRWDPSLFLVMVGAIAVLFPVNRWVARRRAPWFGEKFVLPVRRDVDAKLLLGAAVFGIGWGLGGYCPGPGIVSLSAGFAGTLVFVVFLCLGTLATAAVERAVSARPGGGSRRRAR